MKRFVIYDNINQRTLLLSELSSIAITDFSSVTLGFKNLYREVTLICPSLLLFHYNSSMMEQRVSSTTAPKFI